MEMIEIIKKNPSAQFVITGQEMLKFFEGFKSYLEKKEALYTKSDVLSYLKISSGTLNSWVKCGILHPVKIINKVYFKSSEIEQLVKSDI